MASGSCANRVGIDRCSFAWLRRFSRAQRGRIGSNVGMGTSPFEDDPDKVLPLYAEEAVLWGTLSPMVRADRAALRDYFVTAFRVLPGLKVTFGDQLIRVYGNAAINTGYYTFSYSKDGEVKTLSARYSFTYVNNGERWLIVDHHSSAMPAAPK
jgi:uncharacterized protein (TIGR02246 family)